MDITIYSSFLPHSDPDASLAFYRDVLGFEIRNGKQPHWTGTNSSPRTFGHFGQSGTFLWVDPEAGAACVTLTDRDFGPWAAEAWPAFTDAALSELAA